MNFRENISESIRSIKSNLLRTFLTGAIIAIGIMALVGILTTIDGMQSSVDSSFESLGANSFDILVESSNSRRNGLQEKANPPIYFSQAITFKERFLKKEGAVVSISTNVSGAVEVKYNSEKTNPNINIIGVDQSYFQIKGFKVQSGRLITDNDDKYSANVAVIGSELAKALFPKEKPLNKYISALGQKYKVVGVLEPKGSLNGGGEDRVLFLPLMTGRKFDLNGRFTYNITCSSDKVSDAEYTIAEATGVMRLVRGDKTVEEDSFVIERADAMAKEIEEITGALRMGAFGISFITLLGASIALMNIMMVSVTERTREIGVRKALGASSGKIRLQFLMEAIMICLIGGISGIILGLIMGNAVSKLINNDSSFVVPWAWMFLGFTVCIVVGILSGIIPAFKASKMDPIESLRYE